jgi:hypothetical protein
LKFAFELTRRTVIAIVAIALCAGPVAAYAFTALFTPQQVPSETLPSQLLSPGSCGTLLILNGTLATTSGNMLFSCTNQPMSTSGAGAFQTVSSGVNFPGSAIPVFKLTGTLYTAVYIVTSASQCPAISSPSGTLLTNGTAVTFQMAGQGYDLLRFVFGRIRANNWDILCCLVQLDSKRGFDQAAPLFFDSTLFRFRLLLTTHSTDNNCMTGLCLFTVSWCSPENGSGTSKW